MTLTDWIGFLGVTILLVAFFLNLTNKISSKSFTYIFLNFLGAGIAGLASVLLNYLPFIILEAAWTLVSLISLIKFFLKK
jgi:hypothetical protein